MQTFHEIKTMLGVNIQIFLLLSACLSALRREMLRATCTTDSTTWWRSPSSSTWDHSSTCVVSCNWKSKNSLTGVLRYCKRQGIILHSMCAGDIIQKLPIGTIVSRSRCSRNKTIFTSISYKDLICYPLGNSVTAEKSSYE